MKVAVTDLEATDHNKVSGAALAPAPSGEGGTRRVTFAPNTPSPPASAVYFPSSSSNNRGRRALSRRRATVLAACVPCLLLCLMVSGFTAFGVGRDGRDNTKSVRPHRDSRIFRDGPSDVFVVDASNGVKGGGAALIRDNRDGSENRGGGIFKPFTYSQCSAAAFSHDDGKQSSNCLSEELRANDAAMAAKEKEAAANQDSIPRLYTDKKGADRRPSSPFITGDGFRAASDLIYDEGTAAAVAAAVAGALSGGGGSFQRSSSASARTFLDGIVTEVFVGSALPPSAASSTAESFVLTRVPSSSSSSASSSSVVLPMTIGEVFVGLWQRPQEIPDDGDWGFAERNGDVPAAEQSSHPILSSLHRALGAARRAQQQRGEGAGDSKLSKKSNFERSSRRWVPTVFVQTHLIDRFISDVLTPLATAVIAVRRRGGGDGDGARNNDGDGGGVLYIPFLRTGDGVLPPIAALNNNNSNKGNHSGEGGGGELPPLSIAAATAAAGAVGFTLVTHNSDYSAPWEPFNTRMKNGIVGTYAAQRAALLEYSFLKSDGSANGNGVNGADRLEQKGHQTGADANASKRFALFQKLFSRGDSDPSRLVVHSGPSSSHSFPPRRLVCLRWYAQNTVISHPRLFPIPIGIENRYNVYGRHADAYAAEADAVLQGFAASSAGGSFGEGGQEEGLSGGRRREHRMLVSFSVKTNPKQRGAALAAAKALGGEPPTKDSLVTFYRGGALQKRSKAEKGKERDALLVPFLRAMAGHAFVLAPHGHGLDTHRLWEALYMGCVPITHAAPFRDVSGDGGGIGGGALGAAGSDVTDARSGAAFPAAHDAKLLAYFPIVVLPTLSSEHLNSALFAGNTSSSSSSSAGKGNGSVVQGINYAVVMRRAADRMLARGPMGLHSYSLPSVAAVGSSSSSSSLLRSPSAIASAADAYRLFTLEGMLHMGWWEREVREWAGGQ